MHQKQQGSTNTGTERSVVHWVRKTELLWQPPSLPLKKKPTKNHQRLFQPWFLSFPSVFPFCRAGRAEGNGPAQAAPLHSHISSSPGWEGSSRAAFWSNYLISPPRPALSFLSLSWVTVLWAPFCILLVLSFAMKAPSGSPWHSWTSCSSLSHLHPRPRDQFLAD